MRLFNYVQFINESNESIDSICKKYKIYNYIINDDGTVDVDGDVDLSQLNLIKIPLKFGEVTGSFLCDRNILTDLKGSPSKVGKSFNCNYNELVSLEGAPIEVGGSFLSNHNYLTTLKGGPKKVGGLFSVNDNKLFNLIGSPDEVLSHFSCARNRLVSLEGVTKVIHRNFAFQENELFNFKGFPKVNRNLIIYGNLVENILILFPDERWKECIEYMNEYDVIKDGNKVSLQALEVVYDELGLEVPDKMDIYGYEII